MAQGRTRAQGRRGSPFNCQLCFVLLVFYARHVQNDVALNVGPLPGLINGQQATGQWGNGPTGQQLQQAPCRMPHAACHMPRTTYPSSVSIWCLKLLKAQPLTKRCPCYYCNAHLQQHQNPLPYPSSQSKGENGNAEPKEQQKEQENRETYFFSLSS